MSQRAEQGLSKFEFITAYHPELTATIISSKTVSRGREGEKETEGKLWKKQNRVDSRLGNPWTQVGMGERHMRLKEGKRGLRRAVSGL